MSKALYFIAGIIVVALLSGILFLFIVKKGHEPVTIPEMTQSEETQVPPPPASPAPAQVLSATITYADSGFSPDTLTVKSGTTVTFVNNSSAPFWPASSPHPAHNAYDGTTLSQHCKPGIAAFDSCKDIPPGGSWSFKFDKVGSWEYHDHLRLGFYGKVVVQ